MSKPIGWGKCHIITKDLDTPSAKWTKIGTPKENTTKLTPTKGDKKEAPIEGGENEAVKYSANKYVLEYVLRRLAGRKKPFKDANGVIAHRYAIFVQPEDITVPGPRMDNTVVSLADEFGTEEGGLLTYNHDGLKPDSGNIVKWSTIATDLSTIAEGETLEDTAVVFTDVDAD
ncbi:hypothetical protein [Prevotella sp. KH2C16]|uniref:hypothetical protein n=1 Tax=Prevotella sp. KH2C16 TaxID=1855325 RepID=UPI0008E2A39B|nr:hypothetical protein [Prevotella sp. KH2C16]SFG57032.1 hypothetical protein SAMN05216383_12077 [Prevotella sp. KH2C16]